jgi:outer membrane protein TolC
MIMRRVIFGHRCWWSAVWFAWACGLALLLNYPILGDERVFPFVFREQRTVQVRDPSQLPRASILPTPPPQTLASPDELPARELTLDEAIRTALLQAQVVRILAGVTAVSTGQTIYDPAIVNNSIDQQQGRFDPRLEVANRFQRTENPFARVVPLPDPIGIDARRQDDYALDVGVAKTTTLGGTLRFDTSTDANRQRAGYFDPPGSFFLLNPATRSLAQFSYTQPLLQGGGLQANLAPIILARIETEQSFFRMKDSVQDLVRSTVEGYWALVFARANLRARRWQYEQTRWDYERLQARQRAGLADAADVELAHVASASAMADLIAARADVLDREAALRNLLGLPPYDSHQILPTTPPTLEELSFNWFELLELAERQRPDLIELKLILEADEQQLYLARNQAHPRLDALALYRWNGLEGETPLGTSAASRAGQYTDWTLSVNFSVPLGLRSERASLRRRELLISRDRANLDQGLHAASHQIALSLRNLAFYHQQYRAFRETREAATINLQAQQKAFEAGLVNYLNVLQAITSLANSGTSEARTLLQYNSALATLERQTGTILEVHGIRFAEERFGSIGPLRHNRPYPERLPPTLNDDRYPAGTRAAEEVFDWQLPEEPVRTEPLPAPRGSR